MSTKTAVALLILSLWGAAAHAGTVTYVYTDPQGTPLAEADASGNITATYDYAPYGSQAMGAAPNGPGYTGHVNDPDSGFVYMQARYYDPATGTFLSPDPVGPIPGGYNFNRYAYANDNPISNMDPDGRSGEPNECSIECEKDKQEQRERRNNEPYTGGGVNQFFVGVFKRILNELPKDAGQEDFAPSNDSQAAGMLVGSAVVGVAEAVPTDGESVEVSVAEIARPLRNAHLAGGVHPRTGIPFDSQGFADFSSVTKAQVKITQTGTQAGDIRAANRAAGLSRTPEGYSWHHHQDGTTMQLVPRDIHAQTGHTGGYNGQR